MNSAMQQNNDNDECKLNVSGVTFEPLKKFTKKQMNNYVEDTWHHATLTSNGLVPDNDCRYNDFDYEFKEMLNIIQKDRKSTRLNSSH